MSIKKDLSPFGQILMIVGLMIVGSLLILGLSSISFFANALANPSQNIAWLKLLQSLQSILLFIVPAYVFSEMVSGNYKSYFQFNQKVNSKTAIIVVITIIAAIPFINLLGELNSKMVLPSFLTTFEEWIKLAEERAADMTTHLVSGKTVLALIVNLIMIAVLPAIGEEMIFRGVFQKILMKSIRNIHVAVWISAFIFSAFHLQFYGFLPRFVIGLLLGYLYVASGSLWLPILAHFINNAVATIFYFLFNNGYVTEDLDTLGTGNEWTIGALSGGMLLIIYFYLERNKTELQLDEFK